MPGNPVISVVTEMREPTREPEPPAPRSPFTMCLRFAVAPRQSFCLSVLPGTSAPLSFGLLFPLAGGRLDASPFPPALFVSHSFWLAPPSAPAARSGAGRARRNRSFPRGCSSFAFTARAASFLTRSGRAFSCSLAQSHFLLFSSGTALALGHGCPLPSAIPRALGRWQVQCQN